NNTIFMRRGAPRRMGDSLFHGIIPAPGKGATPDYSPKSQPASFQYSIFLHGMHSIYGATGLESAGRGE
ncbi:hypothetical protein HKBW3S43_01526, partial [Candidatus Hakubella thermalkaliphila]